MKYRLRTANGTEGYVIDWWDGTNWSPLKFFFGFNDAVSYYERIK